MGILCDRRLHEYVSAGEIVTGMISSGFAAAADRIQAASVDLSIGAIYVPVGRELPSGKQNPLTELTLRPGDTVVVVTKEKLDLPATLAGMVYPPARLARDGVLMTNPGHIDPGFAGPLRFTIIHMGHTEKILREGDVVATVVLFQLSEASVNPWSKRNPEKTTTQSALETTTQSALEPVEVKNLPSDFMDLTKKADRLMEERVQNTIEPLSRNLEQKQTNHEATIAKDVSAQISRVNLFAAWVTIGVVAAGAYVSMSNNNRTTELANDLALVRTDLRKLENSVNQSAPKDGLVDLDARMAALEKQAGADFRLRQVEEKVKEIEAILAIRNRRVGP